MAAAAAGLLSRFAAAGVCLLLAVALAAAPANACSKFVPSDYTKDHKPYFIPVNGAGVVKDSRTFFDAGTQIFVDKGNAVKSIAVWVGQRFMTGFQMVMFDNTVFEFGHRNSKPDSFTFEANETLTEFGVYKSDSEGKVSGIAFKTSFGRSFRKRSSSRGDICMTGTAGSDFPFIGSGIFAGLQGYTASDNDIGVLWPVILRPVKSNTLNNITYPTDGLKYVPPPRLQLMYDHSEVNNNSRDSTSSYANKQTVKYAWTNSLSESFKFQAQYGVKTKVEGDIPIIGKGSIEVSQTYTWEYTRVTTRSTTHEETDEQTITYSWICPAYTACRFYAYRGTGEIDPKDLSYTAVYTVTLDNDEVIIYNVVGSVEVDQATYVEKGSQTVPLPTAPPAQPASSTSRFALVAGATNDSEYTYLSERLGAPKLAYVPCSPPLGRLASLLLCRRSGTPSKYVLRKVAERLVMAVPDFIQLQGLHPFVKGYMVVDLNAPMAMPASKNAGVGRRRLSSVA